MLKPFSMSSYQFIHFLLTHTRIFRGSGVPEGNILVDYNNNSTGGTNNGGGISDAELFGTT